MKPLNEVLSSICSTLECEYKEGPGDQIGITEGGNVVHVTNIWCCGIWKNGIKMIDGFASPTTPEGITETTKQTAREWLLLSLITKCINQ